MARPEILFPLFAPVDTLGGVGAKTAKSLERKSITRIKDLIFHLPETAIERFEVAHNLRSYQTQYIMCEVLIGGHKAGRTRSAPYRVRVFLGDEPLDLTFFHARGNYVQQILPMGETRWISGKLEQYGDGFQIIHPDYITKDKSEILRFEPQYSLTEGVSQKMMVKAVKAAISVPHDLPEWVRSDMIEKFTFPSFAESIKAQHVPQSREDVGAHAPSRMRLAYDELLSHQLALALIRAKRKTPRGEAIKIDQDLLMRGKSTLPYDFTNAQKRAIDEIQSDLASEKRMFRMLQGDVGAGKTAVAFMAMVAMASSGAQSVLLAPTEILARQHFEGMKPLFDAIGLNITLMVGANKTQARKLAMDMAASGEADIVIGTHAIVQDKIWFANLGLAIIDEQHRFGVQERMKLVEKGGAVDLLSMSATPIPRSLAMSVYGEMDLSVLDEKPAGRQKIETSLMVNQKIPQLIERLEKVIADQRQIYWVCPLVSESEKLDLVAAEARHKILAEKFGDENVGLVHGRLDADAKDAVMQKFRDGELSILVATTVIEVGVDVPNASVMVIEGAERFGLSQLHQLRGRVGRGSVASNCLLVYDDKIGQTSRERLELMRQSDDGFVLAEADLRMRGAGDLIGTAQSGLPRYMLADLEQHQDLMAHARDDARLIVETDPELSTPRGEALRTLLYLFERDEQVGFISKS